MTAIEALKQYFGYDNFRGGQEKLINDIVRGSDVLGIMPTGAGKSICFQIPALLADGVTLVISPLISLMKDQVNTLTQSGIAAAFINSSLTEREIYYVLQNAAGGVYKLIYIAPERLFMADFLSFAQSSNISMLTVDEAHCISQWGQDFRPSYSKIPEFIDRLPKRPVVSAFTATATPKVREDIALLLRLQKPTILVTGFDRSNLYFEVQKPKDKFSALIDFLAARKELNGIVYCSSRNTVEEVCRDLKLKGYKAARYHAGLQDIERHNNQDDFIFDRIQIMVATNAFGMGIDKSNVSFVVHYNMPKDIESYYQEAGRAGRDGGTADCILLYSGQDVRLNMWLIENSNNTEYPDKETEMLVKERDRKRLKEMTFYCATYNCLRGYILRYFGEDPPPRCGNCVNCNTDFETEDITIEVLKILSCVGRMKERFGVNMIIDVLRGSKNEKVISLKLNQLTTYGISEKTDKRLREIINFLIINGYLQKTDSEYPVIKFGTRANEVLRGGAKVRIALRDEKNINKPIKSITKTALKPVDKRLYAILHKLRKEIAEKQRVPSFAIFSDSTLVDMCMKMPKTSKELLDVSGIGQVKRERYGESFLKAINDFLQNTDTNENSSELIKNPNTPEINLNNSINEIEVTDEPVSVSIIADRISCIAIQHGYSKLSGKRINEWLVFEKYLKIITENGKNYKIPTDIGKNIGILSEKRVIREENLWVNLFEKKAQEFICQNIQFIYNFAN